MLTEPAVKQKIGEWNQSSGTAPFITIFDGIDNVGEKYFIEITDNSHKDRSLMAIIDWEEKKTLYFAARLMISVSTGT